MTTSPSLPASGTPALRWIAIFLFIIGLFASCGTILLAQLSISISNVYENMVSEIAAGSEADARMQEVGAAVDAAATDITVYISALSGVLMIVAAAGLLRRQNWAYWLALGLLVLYIASSILTITSLGLSGASFVRVVFMILAGVCFYQLWTNESIRAQFRG